MSDQGYHNYHYAQEWKQDQWLNFGEPPYQQYSQYPLGPMDTKASSITRLEDILIQFMQVSISNQKRVDTSIQNLNFQVGQIAKKLADQHRGTNTQTNPEEHEDCMSIICDEVIGKSSEMETECNKMFHQTLPLKAKNVVKEDEKEKEILEETEEENKQKREKEDKDEIDRVVDFICALFTKVQLKETWKPRHLYLKFMEFLPNKLKKLDDVISVSFWPP